MINDSHIHLFDGGYRHDSELAEYEILRREYGIGRALVVAYEGEERFRGNNEYILSLARAHEWMRPLLYLDAATTPDQVEGYVRNGAAGFSLYLSDDDISMIDSRLWTALDDVRALVSINASPAALKALPRLTTELARATMLVSHLGLPGAPQWDGPAEWADALWRLSANPRVLIKTSGLYAIDPEPPHLAAEPAVAAALRIFGPGRMVWGSDYPWGLGVVSDAAELITDPPWMKTLFEHARSDVMGANLAQLL